jgi:integrase
LTEDSKNLAKTEPPRIGLAGATTHSNDVKVEVGKYLGHLERENRSKSTIHSYETYLDMLMKIGADLFDGESVKEKVAKQESWGENTKRMAAAVYKGFASFVGIAFRSPRYRINPKIPFIPSEAQKDALIAGSPRRLAALLQLLKETGIRIGEALSLKWSEIDFENKRFTLNSTEKAGMPRQKPLSDKLASMLGGLPRKNERLFGKANYKYMELQFLIVRKRLAAKLQDEKLNEIHFHTLRHWRASKEFSKTRSLPQVMELLGHRNLDSVMAYTHLVDTQSDEYYSAVAKTTEEARKLIEDGFEYVCTTTEGLMLFRKRK